MGNPLDDAITKLAQVYGETLKDQYIQWRSQTNFDLEMGDMLTAMTKTEVWKPELQRFLDRNVKNFSDKGFDFYRLKASWYLTSILVNGVPTPPQVARVYTQAFGEPWPSVKKEGLLPEDFTPLPPLSQLRFVDEEE